MLGADEEEPGLEWHFQAGGEGDGWVAEGG